MIGSELLKIGVLLPFFGNFKLKLRGGLSPTFSANYLWISISRIRFNSVPPLSRRSLCDESGGLYSSMYSKVA